MEERETELEMIAKRRKTKRQEPVRVGFRPLESLKRS
jgi:hypothetical protein